MTISGIQLPLNLTDKNRKLLKSYLCKIAARKQDRYTASIQGKEKIGKLSKHIKAYLKLKEI